MTIFVAAQTSPASPHPQKKLERARQMLEAGAVDQSIGVLREIVREEPENADAHLLLGSALALAAELKPAERPILFQLCRALHKAGKTEETQECQKKLAAMVQNEVSADVGGARFNNDGVELEERGDLNGALEKYRAAVHANPLKTLFRRNLALVLCRLGRWEEGIVELRKVLELDPHDTEAIQALHIALEKAKAAKE